MIEADFSLDLHKHLMWRRPDPNLLDRFHHHPADMVLSPALLFKSLPRSSFSQLHRRECDVNVFALYSTGSSTPAWSQWWWKRLERRPGWSSGEESPISSFPTVNAKPWILSVPPNPRREEAGVQDSFLTYEVYKDDITMQLVADACKLLGE